MRRLIGTGWNVQMLLTWCRDFETESSPSIVQLTSRDLIHWSAPKKLSLRRPVIDRALRMPDGSWRLFYNDDAPANHPLRRQRRPATDGQGSAFKAARRAEGFAGTESFVVRDDEWKGLGVSVR